MAVKKWARRLLLLLAVLLLPVSAVKAEEPERFLTERQIYAYLTGKMGLNSAAACGIMANIEVESGFSLSALGDSGTSYGICQWHEGRYAALVAYCSTRGVDYRSLIGQLEYLHYELRTDYSNLYAQLRQVENSGQGAYEAGYLWCVKFERPADMEQKGVTRGNMAQYKYWLRYQGAKLPQPEDPQPFVSELLENFELPVDVQEWSLAEQPPTLPEAETTAAAPGGSPRRARIKAYVPKHRPAVREAGSAAVGIAVGLQFLTLGDGTPRRKFRLPTLEPTEVPV